MAIDYGADVVRFMADIYPLDTGRAIIPPFLEAWLYTAFPLPAGDPAARNILHSTSKKQGKSALGGVVALYMASRRKYSEVVIAAADQDQAKDRVFKSVKFAVENGPLARSAKVYKDVIELDNSSIIQAIPFDWRGAAGGNYSCVIFDELHVFTTENHRRLWDEMIIPPTQPAGVRWIASYAGFLGESELLYEIWNKALTGERIESELPVYHSPDASLLAMIDQGEESWRMPWSTPGYMAQIRLSERPTTFRRLWLNEWVSAESEFITPEQWAACEHPDVRPLTLGDSRKVIFGADASTSRDLTALVGVTYDREAQLADVVYTRTWKPQKGVLRLGKPTIDLSETIGAEILELHKRGVVQAVYYDPYQLHSLALDLEKAGVKMIELPQTAARTESDQALYDAIVSRSLRHYGDPALTEHINNAVAIESPRGFRLAKEKTTRKIDAAVALSMAHYGALQQQARYGDFDSMPFNPFYELPDDYSMSDLVKAGGRWSYIPNTTARHSAGATSWRDCRNRNRGCDACIAELERDGIYEQDEQMTQARIETTRDRMTENEQMARDRLAIQQAEGAKRNDILQNFHRNARRNMAG